MTRKNTGWFLAAGLVVALILAGVVSNFASSSPDGLDATTLKGCTVDDQGAITGGQCLAQNAEDHQLAGGPLADYGVKGVGNPYLSNGLAGVAGVVITFGVGAGLFWLVRRRRDPAGNDAPDGSDAPDCSDAPDGSDAPADGDAPAPAGMAGGG